MRAGDAAALTCRLVNAANRTDVTIKFLLADIWIQMMQRPCHEKKQFIVEIRVRLGENYLRMIRQAASTARKWPKQLRNIERSWNYFERTNPDGTQTVRTRKEFSLKEVSHEDIDGGILYHLETPFGNPCSLFVKGEETQ